MIWIALKFKHRWLLFITALWGMKLELCKISFWRFVCKVQRTLKYGIHSMTVSQLQIYDKYWIAHWIVSLWTLKHKGRKKFSFWMLEQQKFHHSRPIFPSQAKMTEFLILMFYTESDKSFWMYIRASFWIGVPTVWFMLSV